MILFLTLKNAGGGLRQPLSMSLMYRAFPSHQRGLAMGLYQASHMVGPLIAPLVGGWLVETFGWRSVFYVNIPSILFALLLIMFVMPRELDDGKREWPASVDFIGFRRHVDRSQYFALGSQQRHPMGLELVAHFESFWHRSGFFRSPNIHRAQDQASDFRDQSFSERLFHSFIYRAPPKHRHFSEHEFHFWHLSSARAAIFAAAGGATAGADGGNVRSGSTRFWYTVGQDSDSGCGRVFAPRVFHNDVFLLGTGCGLDVDSISF